MGCYTLEYKFQITDITQKKQAHYLCLWLTSFTVDYHPTSMSPPQIKKSLLKLTFKLLAVWTGLNNIVVYIQKRLEKLMLRRNGQATICTCNVLRYRYINKKRNKFLWQLVFQDVWRLTFVQTEDWKTLTIALYWRLKIWQLSQKIEDLNS